MTTRAAGLGSFSAVDTELDAATLIAALDEQASIPAVQRLRAAAIDLLRAQRGSRILDAGCGTGDLAGALARIVGPAGAVVAVEASATMLAEAQRRHGTGPASVELQLGDICELDHDDAVFDAVVSERVLQHVTRPDRAIAQLARVTRPGGRIAVIDTDWGMHAIHGADPGVTASIIGAWCDNAANGLSGRQLPALFAEAGIGEITVLAETMTTSDPRRPAAPPFTTMAHHAAQAGAIGHDDAEVWLRQLADAGSHGRFFWAVTMFAVAGTRA